MSTAKDIEVALSYLQSECYKSGYPETGYLIEVARLSLEDARRPQRAEAPAQTERSDNLQTERSDSLQTKRSDNLVWLRA